VSISSTFNKFYDFVAASRDEKCKELNSEIEINGIRAGNNGANTMLFT
jgi:hypothetical protein